MTGLIIRESTDDDIAVITRIYGHHVINGVASFEEEAPDQAEMAKRRTSVLEQGMPYLVAERFGEIVGFAYAGPYRPRPAYRYALEGTVYVAPGFEGRGVGTALLSQIIKACEAGPWKQLVAVVAYPGVPGSLELHQKLGFRQVGQVEKVGFKHDAWLDVVILQRAI